MYAISVGSPNKYSKINKIEINILLAKKYII